MRLPIRLAGPFPAILVAALFTAGGASAHAPDEEDRADATPKPSLEQAYRAWFDGFASEMRKQREATLRSMLPTKKDCARLFPEHVERLWPLIERGNAFYVENVDPMAEEFGRFGAILRVELTDIRKDRAASTGPYQRVLAMIPEDVPVFEIASVEYRESVAGGIGPFLYLDRRWIWLPDLAHLPEELDQPQ